MKFCTVINCMDGRVQIPVIQYLMKKFNADYVDSITEAGPNRILFEGKNISAIEAILKKIRISVEKHYSVGIAITGHYDCAGNPASEKDQIRHIKKSIDFLKNEFGNIEILGLWVDKNWKVHPV